MLQKCKNNVLRQFQSIRHLPKNIQAKSCILVLDTVTAPLLSDMFSIQQLLQAGIKDLSRVDRVKKPEPTSIAIYYISCKSLQYLYKDFSNEQKNKTKDHKKQQDLNQTEQKSHVEDDQDKGSLYLSINLLLCQQASEQVLKQISEHQQVIQRIASFGQMYIPCRYVDNNIGIISFSQTAQYNMQKLRSISKVNDKLFNRNSKPQKKIEQQKQQYIQRKRQRTSHNIHKQNLSSLSDIYFYQYQKGQGSKQRSKYEQIQHNLQTFGKKLCQTILGGINIGLNTIVKIVYYQSKFSLKLKQLFVSNFTEFMQFKSKQYQQIKLQQNASQEKSSIFAESNQSEAKQLIVILADRQSDNLSPLVRSFYYQPLLMDIFGIKDPPDRKIHIISTKIQPTTVQVADSVFCQYNNMFLYQVFQKINANLQQYINKNKAAKFQKQKSIKIDKQTQIQMQQKPTTAKQLKQVLKQLPEYKKTIKSYNTNIQILNVIGTLTKQRKMYQETELQHTIITGYGGDKKQVKDKKILEQVLIMIQNKQISVQDKCRLMVLAVCCLDIDNSDRSKVITRLSKIEDHGDIALGLSKISKKGVKKFALPSYVQKNNKQFYMDRHQSIVGSVLEQLITTNNSAIKQKNFKLQQLKALSVIKKPVAKTNLSKQKQRNAQYVVCMCGGLGYNQVSDIEKIMKSYNLQNSGINFITDYLYTPETYLQELCTLI